MFCTILGALYNVTLSWTLVGEGSSLQFPRPFSDIVKFATDPFPMMALFLTGTALQSAEISSWTMFLVLMKVVVCAFISFLLARTLISGNSTHDDNLRDFSFFYGSI